MSTLKVNSIEPANAGSEDYFLARAWVNFNGTGTVAINADGNVSSITDNGTGNYTASFSSNISDANYGFFVTAGDENSLNASNAIVYSNDTRTTSALQMRVVGGDNSTFVDSNPFSMQVTR